MKIELKKISFSERMSIKAKLYEGEVILNTNLEALGIEV